MTIKQIGLSALAATLVTTASVAGTIANTGTVGLIGKEAASLANINLGSAFGAIGKVTYKPSNIPATTVKNPIFKYTFGNGTALVRTDANATVFEYQGTDGNESNMSQANWRPVAGNMQISGTNSEIGSFNAIDGTIYAFNNKTYIVADNDGNSSADFNLTAADINISVAKGSTSNLTLAAQIYSGDSQAEADAASAVAIATVGNEYIGSITTKFNARIDASKSFLSFYDQDLNSSDLADDMSFSLTRKTTLAGASLGDTAADVVLTFDNNLTVNSNTATGTGAMTLANSNAKDANGTVTLTALDTAQTGNIVLDLAGNTKAIPKTIFDIHAYVTSGSTNFNLITKASSNAGSWTLYGYNAQIPNVTGVTGYDTTMKFTNRSGLDTNIYFTLIDPDGTVVSLDSVTNPTLASLAKNTTGSYKASALIALITDTAFDSSTSFSVEVSIPTTPTSVYGMASFKNKTLGQFKDLPVYNSGMSY